MSLECFQATLARVIADTTLIERARQGDFRWLDDAQLNLVERSRLVTMCHDDRMEVLCSLYRSNRLTALVRTVPELVAALGDRLGTVVAEFWRTSPRTDMQFQSEGKAFCAFVATTSDDTSLAAVAVKADQSLTARYAFADQEPATPTEWAADQRSPSADLSPKEHDGRSTRLITASEPAAALGYQRGELPKLI